MKLKLSPAEKVVADLIPMMIINGIVFCVVLGLVPYCHDGVNLDGTAPSVYFALCAATGVVFTLLLYLFLLVPICTVFETIRKVWINARINR